MQAMDFVIREEGGKILVEGGPFGEVVATFEASVSGCAVNPALMAFFKGVTAFPGGEIWNASTANYDVQGARIGVRGVHEEIEEVITRAGPAVR